MPFASQFIRLVDFFSVTPRWYVRGNPKSTSTSGLFFTILMLGFIVWAIFYLSTDLIYRENPKVGSTNLFAAALDQEYELNPDTFAYVFGIQNGDSGIFYIDPTVYTLSGEMTYENLTTKTFSLVKCNPSDIRDYLYYDGDLLCFENNRSDIYLKGVTSIVTFTFSLCKNTTENNNHCKTPEELDNIFTRNDQLFLFFPVTSVRLWNYTNPIDISWNFQNFFLDSTLTKRLSLVLKKIQVVTDDAWLTTLESLTSQTAHALFFFDVGARVVGDFFSVEIFTNGDIEYMSRRYQRIQEFLGEIMGITQTLLLIIAALVIPFTRMKMYQYLGLEVFHLELKKKNQFKQKGTRREKKKTIAESTIVQNLEANDYSMFNNNGPMSPENQQNANFLSPNIVKTSDFQQKGFMNLSVLRQTPEKPKVENSKPKALEPDEDGLVNVNYERTRKFQINDSSVRQEYRDVAPAAVDNLANVMNLTEPAKVLYIAEKRGRGCCRRKTSKKIPLTFSYCEWLFSFCRKTPKMLLAKRLKQEIVQMTDIETVLAKFMEIELLKRLLLTEDQNILFDNICKPKLKLTYEYDRKKGLVYSYKLDDLLLNYAGKKSEADDSYRELKNKMQKSAIDQELIARYEKKQKFKQSHNIKSHNILESWNVL